MKKIAFAAAFTALSSISGIALAADLGSLKDAPEYAYSPSALWTGLYIGGHIGGAQSNIDLTDTYAYNSTDPIMTFGMDKSGVMGGVQIGYNKQSGKLVYGIEADLGKMNISAKQSGHLQDTNFAIYDPKYGYQYALDSNYSVSGGLYGDITGRLGFTANNALFYLKGGAAFLNVDADVRYKGAHWQGSHNFDYSASDTLWGWTLGAGVEYALSPRLRLKAEYQHFDFGSMSMDHNTEYKVSNAITSTLMGNNDIDITADAVTVGINYNLSGGNNGLK